MSVTDHDAPGLADPGYDHWGDGPASFAPGEARSRPGDRTPPQDNAAEQMSIKALLGHEDIEILTTDTGAGALSTLRENACDCVVLDLRLPDMSGFEVLDQIRNDDALSNVPVVVFTGRELSAEEDAELHTMARSIVVKGVESPERLLDETALFLHRVVDDLPPGTLLVEALRINGAGQILAKGMRDSQEHAYVLTPVVQPAP